MASALLLLLLLLLLPLPRRVVACLCPWLAEQSQGRAAAAAAVVVWVAWAVPRKVQGGAVALLVLVLLLRPPATDLLASLELRREHWCAVGYGAFRARRHWAWSLGPVKPSPGCRRGSRLGLLLGVGT